MNVTVFKLVSSFVLLAVLAACGGGSSDSSTSAGGFTVSGGAVQKGPLVQGSAITVNTLSISTWQPRGASYTFEITNNLGNFSAARTVFNAQYAESTALGYYFNELTGVVSNDMVYLRGLSDLKNDKSINLNVLTDMVRARIRALTTQASGKLTFPNARLQAQKELLAAFYIYNSADLLPGGTTQPANFNEIDLSKTRNADQILAAISGVITQMGQNGSGINLALSRLEMDLADDGLINNSPNYSASTVTGLSSAETATNFTAVASNLNAFYGNANFTGTTVGQWIDSSGGVDRVIDRYKFTASGTVGVESPSPFYTAGSDDLGQCMSVTAGKLYRKASGAASATLVTTATIKAVAGYQYQIGLTPTAGPLSGFIQRSAPVAGVCPTTLPTAGLTRVVKFVNNIVPSSPQVTSDIVTSYYVETIQEYSPGRFLELRSFQNQLTIALRDDKAGDIWTTALGPLSAQASGYSSWHVSGNRIARDEAGNIYLALASQLKKYSPSGIYQWSVSGSYQNSFGSVFVNSSGQILSVSSADIYSLIVTKYSSNGSLISAEIARTDIYSTGAALSSDGSIYVSGLSGSTNGYSGFNGIIVKLDSGLNVVWESVPVLSVQNPDLQVAVSNPVVDTSGNIYLGTRGGDTQSGASGIFMTSYSPLGTPRWSQKLNFYNSLPKNLAAKGDQIFGITSITTNAYSYIWKFNPAGDIKWEFKIPTVDFIYYNGPRALCTASDDLVRVTASLADGFPGHTYTIIGP